MSSADSLNEMMNWITEDVTNDDSIALYASKKKKNENNRRHQKRTTT